MLVRIITRTSTIVQYFSIIIYFMVPLSGVKNEHISHGKKESLKLLKKWTLFMLKKPKDNFLPNV